MMRKFSDWMNEGKKGTKDSLPPTVTSAPIRGPNQDQSGVNDKNNVANYTISDSKKPFKEETDPGFQLDEISPELVGKVNKARTIDKKPSKTPEAAKTLRNAVNKAWIKSKVGTVKEGILAGVGKTRIKPVNMAQKTGGTKEPNAPSNVGSMQAAANQRVAQLDKAAQQEKDTATKNREAETAKRQREAANRDTERNSKDNNNYQASLSKRNQKEEFELDEARGRPKKATGEESTNIIMQLRKVITLRGQEPVTFANGARVRLNPGTAHRLLATYDNLKTSGDKHAFSARIHKSPESLRDVVAGKKEIVKPKISLAGKITGTQNADHS